MLKQLDISGLAIVDSASISFSSALNVFTGETGAGKSVVIKALSLVFGGKGSPEDVQRHRQEATVSACFEVGDQHPAVGYLNDLGLGDALEESGKRISILVRRQVTVRGRSVGWINDRLVTMASLKALGSHLIDICAQHENQKILNPKTHLALLDCFLRSPELTGEVAAIYANCEESVKEMHRLWERFQQESCEFDVIEFRLNELDNLEPSLEDYASLMEAIKASKASRQQQAKIADVLAMLEGNGHESAQSLLAEAQKVLVGLEDCGFSDELKSLDLAIQAVNDVSYGLSRWLGGDNSGDEDTIEQKEARFSLYQDLIYKLRVTGPEGLLETYGVLQQKKAFLEEAGQRFCELAGIFVHQAKDLQEVAKRLSSQRRKAAKQVELLLSGEFDQVGMPGAFIKVAFVNAPVNNLPSPQFEPMGLEPIAGYESAIGDFANLSRNGSESVRFLFRPNPGDDPKPLQQIASGGEISRIVLALKNALAAGADTCVMVFDEIDSGISGKTADLVGRKLRALGREFQVICVSHLPQVAAYADRHFLVEKHRQKNRVLSKFKALKGEGRAEELARMLSGGKITPHSIKNAKSLIKSATE